MKRFFLGAGKKSARFFWSWGFLKLVLFGVTLVVLFYVEEDWRGARAWASTKAKWEAQGETFDLNLFVPPPVPDDANLAAIPLFKLEPIKGLLGTYPVVLRAAMRSEQGSAGFLPSKGNWMRGELPDLAKMGSTLTVNFEEAFGHPPSLPDALAQFDALYPFDADFRLAAAKRPLCRLDLDYTTIPPAGRALGLLTVQIRLTQISALHAVLALDHHQPDLAFEDIEANYTLLSGAARNPTLVGGLVAIGVNAITLGALYDGLAFHAWSDAQLAGFEQTLKRIDYLACYQFDMRSTAAEAIVNLDFFKKNASRSDIRGLFVDAADQETMIRNFPPWPGGWWDDNKPQMADFLLQAVTTVDPRTHRAFPKVDLDLQQIGERASARWMADAPWNVWFTISAPPLTDQTKKFACAQAWIDEARIACALERYRLAHGIYPGTLAELAPTYLDAIPHDVINGEPYHYRLNADGIFLLYSVGWNQVDDGGKIVFEKEDPTKIDYSRGDWVWPQPRWTP